MKELNKAQLDYPWMKLEKYKLATITKPMRPNKQWKIITWKKRRSMMINNNPWTWSVLLGKALIHLEFTGLRPNFFPSASPFSASCWLFLLSTTPCPIWLPKNSSPMPCFFFLVPVPSRRPRTTHSVLSNCPKTTHPQGGKKNGKPYLEGYIYIYINLWDSFLMNIF